MHWMEGKISDKRGVRGATGKWDDAKREIKKAWNSQPLLSVEDLLLLCLLFVVIRALGRNCLSSLFLPFHYACNHATISLFFPRLHCRLKCDFLYQFF